jgi:hypothetical protein
VYVTGNGHWKLGGFECACRFTEASPDFLKSISQIRNESSIPPEESVCIYFLKSISQIRNESSIPPEESVCIYFLKSISQIRNESNMPPEESVCIYFLKSISQIRNESNMPLEESVCIYFLIVFNLFTIFYIVNFLFFYSQYIT